MMTAQYQRGFLMPVALFVLIVMGIFALTLSRQTAHGNVASVQEAVSIQAFYAAESGAQFAMNQLFYQGQTQTAVDANCVAIDGNTLNFTAASLNQCRSLLRCTRQSINAISYYTIQSDGRCGSGSLSAQRSIAVSALME